MSGMTVRQLIAALSGLPEDILDYPVETEGCDCDGDAGSLETDMEMRRVYIRRAVAKELLGKAEKKDWIVSEEEAEARRRGLLP